MAKKITTYFNIRTINAKSKEQAIEKLENGQISEGTHNLSDELVTEQELRDAMFPNGFESWTETHHEIVSAIARNPEDAHNKVNDIEATQGIGGLYEFAKELTDKFEEKYKGREWDGEFFDTIYEFIEEEFKND